MIKCKHVFHFPQAHYLAITKLPFDTTVLLFPHYNYVNCVPRVCLEGALSNEVLSFWLHIPNSCSQNVCTSCARCLFMHCSIFGWLSAFVRVSRHKTLCMYHISYCFLLVFVFCLINIFSSSSSSSRPIKGEGYPVRNVIQGDYLTIRKVAVYGITFPKETIK